jgi:hypothetical protein
LALARVGAVGLPSAESASTERGGQKRVVDTPEPPHADAEPSDEERVAAGGDDSLQTLARDERDYARERLSRELGREPTEDEIDDWLRRQTEGY